MNEFESQQTPIEIAAENISKEALIGIIDAFILREGTDYGLIEANHQTKFQQIETQIQKGDTKIVFDPATETVTLLTQTEWLRLTSHSR
jgi:uncharacterized protein YheU (UPF0270 family)